jgi:hypothetical protein
MDGAERAKDAMSSCGRGRLHRVTVRRWGRIAVMAPGTLEVASWPLEGADHPDLATVDDLARLQLAARRMGWSIVVREPCEELVAVADLVGLRLEVLGQPEGGEQRRVEEEVHPDDPVT